MLDKLPKDRLLDLFFLQVRNLWRVDGLYFLGIEELYGVAKAIDIDTHVWTAMASTEAKNLQRIFKAGDHPDIPTIIFLLRMSSWALDQPFKAIQVDTSRAIITVNRCRIQEQRNIRGLPEFPCKNVRHGYLRKFTATLNPNINVTCVFCPPDPRPEGAWCMWELSLR